MSLKAFHVFFIIISILLTVLVGVWGVHQYVVHESGRSLALGGIFFFSGLGLVVYLTWFFAKLKEL
jgi:hypothetical protein